MRIAYISPYQGCGLIAARPITKNLALAANVKIELIAELLQRRSHSIEVLSQGEVVETQFRFFPGFQEPKPFNPSIPVFYTSSFPVRGLNGWWANTRLLRLFEQRHRANPYDLVLLYNLKGPQVIAGNHAVTKHRLPLVFEYEDDAFVDLKGNSQGGLLTASRLTAARRIVDSCSACIGVSPHLLSRITTPVPKLLLRGVVDDEILAASRRPLRDRKNWVAFTGTHFRSKGLEPLIAAWKSMNVPGWELHIAGRGELTDALVQMSAGRKDIVFHGLLNRRENARFLAEAKIGMNPHDLSNTPGNVFAFKIIEYIAAGLHCVSTPMGALEPEIEAGITYIPDNSPQTIADALTAVIANRRFEALSPEATHARYGPEAVADALDRLVRGVQDAQ